MNQVQKSSPMVEGSIFQAILPTKGQGTWAVRTLPCIWGLQSEPFQEAFTMSNPHSSSL